VRGATLEPRGGGNLSTSTLPKSVLADDVGGREEREELGRRRRRRRRRRVY